jgi:GAF domain-containing protein
VNSCALRIAKDIASQTLRELTPAAVWAYYRYNSSSDALVCELATADKQNLLSGLTIQLGERVSGWSAANRVTVVNSEASLDLSHIASQFSPALRSVICVPITDDEILIGVLSGYCSLEEAFSESHRYTAERVAFLLKERLHRVGSPQHIVVPFRGSKP